MICKMVVKEKRGKQGGRGVLNICKVGIVKKKRGKQGGRL